MWIECHTDDENIAFMTIDYYPVTRLIVNPEKPKSNATNGLMKLSKH